MFYNTCKRTLIKFVRVLLKEEDLGLALRFHATRSSDIGDWRKVEQNYKAVATSGKTRQMKMTMSLKSIKLIVNTSRSKNISKSFLNICFSYSLPSD